MATEAGTGLQISFLFDDSTDSTFAKHPTHEAVLAHRLEQQSRFDAQARVEKRRECKDCHGFATLNRKSLCIECEVSK